MKEPYAGDIRLIQINGKFFKHMPMDDMSNAFIRLMILVDDDVATALREHEVRDVVVVGNLVNIITR